MALAVSSITATSSTKSPVTHLKNGIFEESAYQKKMN